MNIGNEDYLAHYGIKGQKWGLRRYQNEDGSLTEEGKRRYGNAVFISGTTKTHEEGSYKRDELPKKITDKIDEYRNNGRKILVGDAPGIDSQVQDYLAKNNYGNVEVFVSGDEVRKMAGEKLGWKVNNIDGENFEKYSKEWRAVKDKAMNAVASEGLAVVIKDGSGATRKNIDRFIQNGKAVMVYQLDDENFVDPILNQKEYEKMKHDDLIEKGSEFLAHYGIKGMRRGIRRWTNEDGTLTEAGKEHYGIASNKRVQKDYDYARKHEMLNFSEHDNALLEATINGVYKDRKNIKKSPSIEELEKNIDKHDKDIMNNKKLQKTARNAYNEVIKAHNFEKDLLSLRAKDINRSPRAVAAIHKGRIIAARLIEYNDKNDYWIGTTSAPANYNKALKLGKIIKKTRKRIEKEGSDNKQNQTPKRVQFEDMVDGKLEMHSVELKPGQTANDAIKEYYNKKNIKHDDLVAIGEEFLAHYGIKGQQWGQRRFQNEDGTLTPEGRRRYGLNPKYAGMSDKELREALDQKRTQNKYVELMTEAPRKKQNEIRELTKTAFSTAKTGVGIIDATKWQSIKNQADAAIKEESESLKGRKPGDPEYDKAKENIQMYKNVKEGYKAEKEFLDKALGASEYPSKFIAKAATDKEIKEKTAEAKRNIQEMDHDELKKTVDRILLEKQYDELVNPPPPSKVERGREILQSVGSILGVILTTLTIAKFFKDWKGGGKSAAQSDEDGEYLAHYRTRGSKNGVRRYQNEDGSLTPEGYRHYGIDPNGRQAADPREMLARQRAQQQMQAREAKAQRRQAGYTQKFQQRQALREARNQAAIQRIYDRQAMQTQREQTDIQNKAAAENRANIRKNIVKGVAAVAAIGAALYVGRHFLRERALDNQYARDVGKLKADYQGKIDLVKEQSKTIQYENETKRKLGMKGLELDRYKAETEREKGNVEKFKAKTSRIESKALRENEELNKKVKSLSEEKNNLVKDKNAFEKQNKSLRNELETKEKQRKVLEEKSFERGKKIEELTNKPSENAPKPTQTTSSKPSENAPKPTQTTSPKPSENAPESTQTTSEQKPKRRSLSQIVGPKRYAKYKKSKQSYINKLETSWEKLKKHYRNAGPLEQGKYVGTEVIPTDDNRTNRYIMYEKLFKQLDKQPHIHKRR